MNRIKKFGLLLSGVLIVFLLFSALPAFAQSGVLEVRCLNNSGALEQNVQVSILPMGAKKGKEKKSDSRGVAVFDKLANGVYRVVGRKAGFAPALYEFVEIKGGKESVDLKLAVGTMEQKLYFEDPGLEGKAATSLQNGVDALKQGRLEDAEKLIKQSMSIHPSSSEAFYYYGIVLLEQFKYDQGVEALNNAIHFANIRKTIATTSESAKSYEAIARNAQEHITTMPVRKADDALRQNKLAEAAALYSEAIKANPGNVQLYLRRAVAQEGDKKFADAAASYSEGLKIQPDSAVLYAGLARALTQEEKIDEALIAINKANSLSPGNEEILTIKKSIDSRIAHDRTEKANAMLVEGNSLLTANDAAGALAKYEETNKLTDGKQPVIWRQIGRSLAKLNRADEAEAAFKKAIELAAENQKEEYRLSLAQLYMDNKRSDEALDLLAAGARNGEAQLFEIFTKLKNSNPALAEAALERVIKMNPNNADAYYELGRLYYADGRSKDTMTQEALSKYLEIGKDENKIDEAKNLLIVIRRRIGK